jgi:hypothetical protein
MDMIKAPPKTGHSAVVRLWLEAQDRIVSLSHVCDEFVIAREDASVPPCEATVVFEVDGNRYERRVRLNDGLAPSGSKTFLTSL